MATTTKAADQRTATLEIRRLIPAARERVFDAWTQAKELDRWSAPWTELVRVRSTAWRRTLENDSRFHVVAVYPASPLPAKPNALTATVLRKDRMQ